MSTSGTGFFHRFASDFKLSDAEFDRIRVLVREHTGISLSEAKRQLVYGRLSRRLRALKLTDFSSYIFGWLVGYSGLLGPIAGVMIADYFLVRRSHLKLDDLYRRNGLYEYENGINLRAVAALVVGIVIALLGLVIPPLRLLYDYAWFVGFGVSGAVYVMLMQRADVSAGRPVMNTDN